jgi:hypothetical protein
MEPRSRTAVCWSTSSEVVQSRAGARAATEAVLVAEATQRALLRAQVVVLVVLEGLAAPRLALVALEAAVALAVALAPEEVAEGVSEAVIVEASEEASAGVVAVETDLVVVVVASATKDRTAMAHLTAPLLVLEDHEVGLVAAAAVATTAAAVIVVETVIEATVTVVVAVTGAEATVTADPAEPTTSRLVGTDTTSATVEAETATAVGTTRANARTRAIATTTGARAGDTKSRSIQGALRWVCHRFTSHFFTLPSSSTRVRPRTHMDRIGIGG